MAVILRFIWRKGYIMEDTAVFKGVSLRRLLQGIALGAISTMFVGFVFGGWILGSTAKQLSAADARSAVVAVLAPICANKFQNATDATANLASLKKGSYYQKTYFIEKGGWAVLPGSDKASDGVAEACAVLLSEMK